MEEIIIIQLTGLLLILISLPFVFQKIKPNRWYGFRTPATLSNEKIWYKANRQTAIDMIILGGCMSFGSLLVLSYENLFTYFPFFILGGVFIVMIRGYLLISKMKKESQ